VIIVGAGQAGLAAPVPAEDDELLAAQSRLPAEAAVASLSVG